MGNFSKINANLEKFAKTTPADGMHISYLDKASELIELYSEALCIMEDEKNAINEAEIERISNRIQKIVNNE